MTGRDNSKEFWAELKSVTSLSADVMSAPSGELNTLQAAAQFGLHRHVRILLDTFPDINPNLASNGTSPALLLAAKTGSYDVIRVFKEHKMKQSGSGRMTANFSVKVSRERTMDTKTRSIGN